MHTRPPRALGRKPEEIREQAAALCGRRRSTLWTPGQPRQEADTGWIVPIVLRCPEGYEGTLGELAWDDQGRDFTRLAERAVLSERARFISSNRPSDGAPYGSHGCPQR